MTPSALERVGDRVHHRGRRADRAALADALEAPRCQRGRLDVAVLDGGHLGRRRQEVVEEGRRERVAVVVVHELLVQHAADALHHAAVDLALDDVRVDHDAAVLAHHVAEDRDFAGRRVDRDRADVTGVGEHERRSLVATDDVEPALEPGRETTGVQRGGHRDLRERHRSRRRPRDRDRPADDVEVLGRSLQEMGRDREDLLAHLERGLADGGAEHGPTPAAAGPEGVRRRRGVALVDGDVVGVDAEMLGDDLRGRGLQSLPVRARAQVDVDVAVERDADVRGLRPVGPHPGLRLDVQADAQPEAAALVACAGLLGAELLVPDQGGGLLEGLFRRHLVDRQAARHGVWELVAVDHVAPAQLERVQADLAGEDVEHALARERLELPRAAVGRAGAGVRVDGRGSPRDPRESVRAAEHHHDEDTRATRAHDRVRAGVVQVIEVRAEQMPVGIRGQGDGDALGARVRGRDEVLPAVLHPLDRAPELVRGEDDHLLVTRRRRPSGRSRHRRRPSSHARGARARR